MTTRLSNRRLPVSNLYDYISNLYGYISKMAQMHYRETPPVAEYGSLPDVIEKLQRSVNVGSTLVL